MVHLHSRACRLFRLLVIPGIAVLAAVHAKGADDPGWWPALGLRDLQGSPLRPSGRWTVVVFLSPECPVANGYIPELNRLASAFRGRGVTFIGAYSDPTADVASFRENVRDFSVSFPSVDDRAQRLVRFASATYTPEAFVFSNEGKVLYHGRIDDRVTGIGAAHLKASQDNLREVLNRLEAGEAGPFPNVPGFGCSIVNAVPTR